MPQPSWFSTHGKRATSSSVIVIGPLPCAGRGSSSSREATTMVGCTARRVAVTESAIVDDVGINTTVASTSARARRSSSAGDHAADTRSVKRGNAERSRSTGASSAISDRNGGTPIRNSPAGSLPGAATDSRSSTDRSTARASA